MGKCRPSPTQDPPDFPGTSALRSALDARVLQPLRHGVLAIDEDGVIRTRLLALAAPCAVLLDHGDDAEEARGVADRHHLERLERAALDALLAAGAGLLVDEGDGPLVLLEHVLHVAVLVEDRVDRADRAAGAAVDAELRHDDVQRLAVARDRIGRAPLGASRAADAGLDDPERHATSAMDFVAWSPGAGHRALRQAAAPQTPFSVGAGRASSRRRRP